MVRVLATRFALVVPTLIVASLLTFSLTYLMPGDPATVIAGDYASPERLAQIRAELGLDRSAPERLMVWFGSVFVGDLGSSLISGVPVLELIGNTLPLTLQLVVIALIFSLLLGSLLGLGASLPRNPVVKRAANTLASVAISVPNFWLGMMLVAIFSLSLGWFPATGGTLIFDDPINGLRQSLLPGIALGMAGAAEVSKQLSSSTTTVMREDFIMAARSRGMSGRQLTVRDVLPSASIAPLTAFGALASRMLGSTVSVEVVFGMPGLGSLTVQAAAERDIPTLQGVVLILAAIVVLISLLVDLAYYILDPRIRT